MTQLALLGTPVTGAVSPALHRAAYAALGLPWRYRAIDCPPSRLGEYLAAGRAGAWAGFSLTMPLKRLAVPMLDQVSSLARQTGTVNTVVARAGWLVGENTDVHGMTAALRALDAPVPPMVTILGGGATACTALAAVRSLGATEATAVLRDTGRAAPLAQAAERIGIELRVRPWAEAAQHLAAGLVISTVPPGAADSLAGQWRPGHGLLLDVCYRPGPTPLARSAREAGRLIAEGAAMLVQQAAQQVVLQTGCPQAPMRALWAAAEAAASIYD